MTCNRIPIPTVTVIELIVFRNSQGDGTGHVVGPAGAAGSGGRPECDASRAQNTLDSLLDELQTAKSVVSGSGTLRRLHSYPSSESKPPVPERHTELSGKRIPPPPPPRTSSKSPLASPTNPNAPVRLVGSPTRKGSLGSLTKILKDKLEQPSASNSSSCESINSQEGIQTAQSRQEQLEQRHQELLRKQKALQEQYTRLQQLQKTSPPDLVQLKKTGSESNILAKIGLGMSAVNMSNSMSMLAAQQNAEKTEASSSDSSASTASTTTASKTIYETDILWLILSNEVGRSLSSYRAFGTSCASWPSNQVASWWISFCTFAVIRFAESGARGMFRLCERLLERNEETEWLGWLVTYCAGVFDLIPHVCWHVEWSAGHCVQCWLTVSEFVFWIAFVPESIDENRYYVLEYWLEKLFSDRIRIFGCQIFSLTRIVEGLRFERSGLNL